jgi:Endonuclease/Exonuclease/phosphatase family
MRTYYIAWWNLENLFDEENAVALGRRTDKVFRAIKNDIAGWTPQLRDRKIDQLASLITTMNNGRGPDLLGVCEVENRFVVDGLLDRVNSALPAPRSLQLCMPTPTMPAELMSHSSTTTPCSRSPCTLESRCSSMW